LADFTDALIPVQIRNVISAAGVSVRSEACA